MNKKIAIGVGAIMLAVLGVALFLSPNEMPGNQGAFTDQEMNARRQALAASWGQTNVPTQAVLTPIDLAHNLRLAIGGLGLLDENQNRQLGDLVEVQLTGARGFELVERQSLAAILQELNLNWSGFVRAKDAVRVGKLLKADWFLLGTETKINGTNFMVARVVDARTGVMRDAGAFPAGQPSTQLAADLAAFMRQCRQDAASPKLRVYLAVGAFEDLSLNNRQANFPTQLRGYLTTAYRGTSVTLLEREYVETLLQEVRLDLAGLTEGSEADLPPTLQSAFWLVSGQYQSYETTNFQVEVTFDVRRIFGKHWERTIRGVATEAAGLEIKQTIDDVMNQNSGPLTPTRMSEARLQMDIGKELTGLHKIGGGPLGYDLVWINQNWDQDPEQAVKEKRNMEEAMHAFETVLLLEPTNRLAKMYMAACLRNAAVSRPDEARNYYREIIDDPANDQWTKLAPKALMETFGRYSWGAPPVNEEARWFEAAALQATNPPAAEFFRRQAESARKNIDLENDSSQAQKLAESNILLNITNSWLEIESIGVPINETAFIENFTGCFGTNQAAAAQRLEELYPDLKAQAPALAPYLLAQFVTVQVDTNAPLVSNFKQMVETFAPHPEQVFLPEKFWWHIWPAYKWSCDHKLYGTAARLLEGKLRAASLYPKHVWGVNNTDRLGLAFAYLGTQEWEKAMRIFETYSNQPIGMDNGGPWGQMHTLIFPGQEVAYCREKLGLPAMPAPTEFSMGKPIFCLCTPSTFVADDNGLWVGIDGQLLHLDFELRTNLVINLPMSRSTPITALCPTPGNIWVATDGDGLINCDQRSRKCRRLAVEDGLMMNAISSLYLAGDALWMGYGHRTYAYYGSGETSGGGLGKLDLLTGHFTSYTLSLTNGPDIHRNPGGNMVPETGDKPTRRPVLAIAGGAGSDIWFVTEDSPTRLRQYRANENIWTQAMSNCSCLVSDQHRLFAGQFWGYYSDSKIGLLGVSGLSLNGGQWQSFREAAGLPSGEVTTLTLDGKNLWVGGTGYIALADPIQGKVLRFSYVKAKAVDRIQIAGGYLWAQFDWHLYRAPLSTVQ